MSELHFGERVRGQKETDDFVIEIAVGRTLPGGEVTHPAAVVTGPPYYMIHIGAIKSDMETGWREEWPMPLAGLAVLYAQTLQEIERMSPAERRRFNDAVTEVMDAGYDGLSG